MELTMSRLQEILSEAYDCGYLGSDEQRNEDVAELFSRHQINEADDKPPPPKEEKDLDFRLYNVSDLRDAPVGTVFIHSSLGKCRIQKRNSDKYMAFDNPGFQPAGFNVDGYPWDMPMKKV